MQDDKFENTKHPIKVGGKDATGHTARHIDPHNPPKQPAAEAKPQGNGSAAATPAKTGN